MKKIAAILLAIIVATCAIFSTVASAADATEAANDFGFAFVLKNDSVTVDVKNKLIYGFEGVDKGVLTKEILLANIDANSELGFTLDAGDYIGTGSVITIENKDGVPTEFKAILVGDLNGDGVFDVLDAAAAQKLSTGKTVDFGADADIFEKAADLNEDGAIDANDYSAQVNGVATEAIDQPADGTDTKIEFEEIGTQPYTGVEVTPEGEVVINFDGGELELGEHFKVVSYTENIELGTATMVVEGTGVFAGQQTLTFQIVGLLEDIANEMDTVCVEAGLERLVSVDYDSVAKNFAVTVNATELLKGNIDGNMAALNGLLTKMDAYRAENLQGIDLTVGDYEVAVDGAVNRGELKGLIFDFAKGFFADFANSADNIAKAYSAVLVEQVVSNNEVVDAQTNFGVKLEVVGAQSDIDTLKNVSGKLSRYMGFSVVDGNAVIDITMPAGFATKVVDVLSNGTGSVEEAKAVFNGLTIDNALELLSHVSVEDISASSADEINRALSLAMQLVGVANKVLDEVTEANVTDMNGKTEALLNGKDFAVVNTGNKLADLVNGVRAMLSTNVADAYISTFANGEIYTAAFDATLAYKNISETVIVNIDVFGAVETPTIIEETAKYFSGIIADLGLANVAKVSYDKEACRAVASLNAREFATNLKFDESGLDGLYTEIKGYFDDNYGTATINVGGYEIVTAGAINKTALKNFIFAAAKGFFVDASNIGADNVLRSFNTVVTEADGTTHKFDLDFALEGSDEDIARIEKIAAKVANYVSFEVVNGNAVVNVALPEGMRNTIVDVLGDGDAQVAKTFLDERTIEEAFEILACMDAEHISTANAKEIQAIVDLICGFDVLVNKVLNKVDYAKTTVNGVTYDIVAENANFDLEGASSIEALVKEVAAALNPALKGLKVGDFANENGTYTLTVDAATTIGGIKETVVLNLDVFGDIEKKNAIEDTVDYVGGILADLGLSDMASVTFEDGKAVAAFNASKFIENDGFKFDENSFDGLYTEIRGYFDDNFSNSTITVGGFDLVIDGKINKPAVKDFIFDFATGFFSDVANMDAATLRSYNTVVVDADGNVEEFAFDFNLDGEDRHIEKIKDLSAKVAAHVSFEEVNGNAVVSVNLPEGMKKTIVDVIGEGDAQVAKEFLNERTVGEAFEILACMDAEHISASSAKDIERIIGVICDVSVLANKVLSKVDNASIVVNGADVDLLKDGAKFNLASNDIKGLVGAVSGMLSDDVLNNVTVADFENKDGSYTLVVNAGTTIGGINETVTINVDIF